MYFLSAENFNICTSFQDFVSIFKSTNPLSTPDYCQISTRLVGDQGLPPPASWANPIQILLPTQHDKYNLATRVTRFLGRKILGSFSSPSDKTAGEVIQPLDELEEIKPVEHAIDPKTDIGV